MAGIEYRLNKPQQRTILSLVRERDRLVMEIGEVNQAIDDLAERYAADFGEARRVIFEQRGDRIFLVAREEEPPEAAEEVVDEG